MMNDPYLDLDILATLRFFDEAVPESRYHATAVVATAGEEMGIGLAASYFNQQGAIAEVLPGPVTQGRQKGHRLDRWLRVTTGQDVTCYQAEIKNWSAHAIGGRRLMAECTPAELAAFKVERWNRVWDGTTFRSKPVLKVLTPMKPPLPGAHVEPLLCIWVALHPTGADDPLFTVDLAGQAFPRAWIFSMSAFLRQSLARGIRSIQLPMPDTTARLQWLTTLFTATSGPHAA